MRIKFSERGLTFSFKENDTFKAGTRYRYVVDLAASEVILLPDENGKYKLSKKGALEKPLVDLRNEEIKAAMAMAQYMEVEVLDDKIIVHIIKTSVNTESLSEASLSDMIDKSDKVTFEVDKKALESNSSALCDMLKATGLLSEETISDMSYVFDFASLFCGAGPLDYPFAKDDSFNPVLAVDFNKAACATYRENIGDHVLCMDMRDLKATDVPAVDLILGGVCCQGYSNQNRTGNTVQDIKKRKLVDDYIRIVKAKKPMMFVIENVPQFLTKEDGKYLEKVLTGLSEYNITYSVVNDSDLGGYTTRKRMILIGSSKDMPKVAIPDVVLTSERKTAGDALKKVTPEWYNYYDLSTPSPSTTRHMSQVRPGHNFRDIPELADKDRQSNYYRRLSYDRPAVTVTNVRKTIMMPPEGNRMLSVAEAAALMGLDKSFKFLGALRDKQQQVANCVTQATAEFVKSIVKKALYDYANSKYGLGLLAA